MEPSANSQAGPTTAPWKLMRPGRPWRTALFLLINLAAYAAVNAFWRYLAIGEWVSFRPEAYYGDLTSTVAETLRHPLDVLGHPWMILVAGLLLGLVVFVPIVIAVLYRPTYAVPFVLAIAVLAHAPVLALAVGVGCVMGGRSRLRNDMPFLAFVMGLLPAAAYLALSALSGVDATAVMPLQRWALYAPFLLAFVAAVLAGALVLALAQLTGFRSGMVCPVLVALLAGPAAVFYLKIGPDELDYALIVNRLQASGSLFDDEALDPWKRRNRAEGLNPQTTRARVQEDLRARRGRLVARCRRFLDKHPESDRRPAILWLAAQAASLQLDELALAGGLIKYSASFPLPQSAPAWEELRGSFASSPKAALADWRMGEMALRSIPRGADPNAAVARADECLHRAAEALTVLLPALADRQGAPEPAGMFSPPADVPSRDYYRGALEAVERLIWLMDRNRVRDDPNSAEALGAYLDLNPKQPDYYQRLQGLLSDAVRKREKTALGDNLKLAVALHTPDDYERADQLMQLAKDERTDAAIVANFELGKFALRTAEDPARVLITGLKTPEEYFRIVMSAPPNPYQAKAAALLAGLPGRTKSPS